MLRPPSAGALHSTAARRTTPLRRGRPLHFGQARRTAVAPGDGRHGARLRALAAHAPTTSPARAAPALRLRLRRPSPYAPLRAVPALRFVAAPAFVPWFAVPSFRSARPPRVSEALCST